MCGIIGLTTTSSSNHPQPSSTLATINVVPRVVNALKLLTYRGYDSTGLATRDATTGEFITYKAVGKINNLISTLPAPITTSTTPTPPSSSPNITPPPSPNHYVGIGHCRWATHGGVTQENAHPHESHNKLFTLVHNGIIENFYTLSQHLAPLNYPLIGETDSEIIVGLLEITLCEYILSHKTTTPSSTNPPPSQISPSSPPRGEDEYCYKNFYLQYQQEIDALSTEEVVFVVQSVVRKLQGSYALCIMFLPHRDVIYGSRLNSPLCIGFNKYQQHGVDVDEATSPQQPQQPPPLLDQQVDNEENQLQEQTQQQTHNTHSIYEGFIGSDASCLNSCEKLYFLQNFDIVVLTPRQYAIIPSNAPNTAPSTQTLPDDESYQIVTPLPQVNMFQYDHICNDNDKCNTTTTNTITNTTTTQPHFITNQYYTPHSTTSNLSTTITPITESFMFKEINEQATLFKHIANQVLSPQSPLTHNYHLTFPTTPNRDVLTALPQSFNSPKLDQFHQQGYYLTYSTADFWANLEFIRFLACGSSYHASLLGVYYLEHLAEISAVTEVASEFTYRHPKLPPPLREERMALLLGDKDRKKNNNGQQKQKNQKDQRGGPNQANTTPSVDAPWFDPTEVTVGRGVPHGVQKPDSSSSSSSSTTTTKTSPLMLTPTPPTHVVFSISQSGETSDTLQALQYCLKNTPQSGDLRGKRAQQLDQEQQLKQNQNQNNNNNNINTTTNDLQQTSPEVCTFLNNINDWTISLCNTPQSSLTRACAWNIAIGAGVERAVASTKAFALQSLWLLLLSLYIAELKQKKEKTIQNTMIPQIFNIAEQQQQQQQQQKDANHNDFSQIYYQLLITLPLSLQNLQQHFVKINEIFQIKMSFVVQQQHQHNKHKQQDQSVYEENKKNEPCEQLNTLIIEVLEQMFCSSHDQQQQEEDPQKNNNQDNINNDTNTSSLTTPQPQDSLLLTQFHNNINNFSALKKCCAGLQQRQQLPPHQTITTPTTTTTNLFTNSNQILLPLLCLIKQLTKTTTKTVLLLGRGYLYPIALECALKLKELTYIPCTAYPMGELKHGPLSLVDAEQCVIIAFLPYNQWFHRGLSNIEEVLARGGNLFVITDERGYQELLKVNNKSNTSGGKNNNTNNNENNDDNNNSHQQQQQKTRTTTKSTIFTPLNTFQLHNVEEVLQPFLSTVLFQYITYFTALFMQKDVDCPRNLAKCVSTE